MSTTPFPSSRRKPVRQTKYLIGAFLIFGAIGYLIFTTLVNTGQPYYKKPSELLSKGASAVGQGARVGGNLVQDSIKQDLKSNQISFVITDGAKNLPISYSGVMPDTFDKATEVIAEGKLTADGTFNASLVLAKCPSKYDAANVPASDYRWQTFGSNTDTNTNPQNPDSSY